MRRFFSPNDFHDHDIAYVANVLGVPPEAFSSETCTGTTQFTNHKRILELQGFRPFDDQGEVPSVMLNVQNRLGNL